LIVQALILITGAIAVWLSQDHREQPRRYACLFGLAGQPLWIYSTAQAELWGMLVLSVIYTAAWWKGFLVHWWRRTTPPGVGQ
jgi:hypothetical protein